jgi:hypothetical protein
MNIKDIAEINDLYAEYKQVCSILVKLDSWTLKSNQKVHLVLTREVELDPTKISVYTTPYERTVTEDSGITVEFDDEYFACTLHSKLKEIYYTRKSEIEQKLTKLGVKLS